MLGNNNSPVFMNQGMQCNIMNKDLNMNQCMNTNQFMQCNIMNDGMNMNQGMNMYQCMNISKLYTTLMPIGKYISIIQGQLINFLGKWDINHFLIYF